MKDGKQVTKPVKFRCFSPKNFCETKWKEPPKGKEGTIPVFLAVGKFKRSKILLPERATHLSLGKTCLGSG